MSSLGHRPDALTGALNEAIAGRPGVLFDLLARGSHLPGPRANDALADAFADACRAHGEEADGIALRLAHLPLHDAPGATALEFLPVCGLLALAARASSDESVRARFVAELHGSADDRRFRVRDAVVEGLARVGGAAGIRLVDEVASWMDGYFHAAAVLRALAHDTWLSSVRDADPVLARLREAFELARDAPRAAARYPGHKALIEALERTPAILAFRFGVPVFDMLVGWSVVDLPALRDAIAGTLRNKKLGGRFRREVDRVQEALEASLPAPRNPDHDVGPTRDRSGSRRRGRPR
jgi:hypothetical protein